MLLLEGVAFSVFYVNKGLKPYTSRFFIVVHVIFLAVFTNLTVRDALPFGVRTSMDNLEIYKGSILSIWCFLNVVNFHHYGFAIFTALIAMVAQNYVDQAPAMAIALGAAQRNNTRMLHLIAVICVG